MKNGGRFLLHKENLNPHQTGSGIMREMVCEQRLYRYLTGTAGGSKQMNIVYLLIFKLDEPDVILKIHYSIKPWENGLSQVCCFWKGKIIFHFPQS